MTAEIYEKPGKDEDASAREGGSGDGRRERKREEEREDSQSLRSKGGRNGENSDKNKGSLSLYLAAFRVASRWWWWWRRHHQSQIHILSSDEGAGMETKRVSRRRVLQSQISQSALHCRTVLATGCGSSARSNIRSKSGHCPFRTSSTRRHAWLAAQTLVIPVTSASTRPPNRGCRYPLGPSNDSATM
jgi:hypothetical protein